MGILVKTMDGGEVNAGSIETKATIEILIHARRGRFGQNEIKVVFGPRTRGEPRFQIKGP